MTEVTSDIAAHDPAPILSVAHKYGIGRRIASNTGLLVGAKGFGALLSIGSFLIAARALDTSSLGVIIFLHAYMLFFSEVATFQAWQPIIRFGTDDVQNNDADGLAKLLQFGLKLDVISAILSFIAAIVCFGPIVGFAEQTNVFSLVGADGAVRPPLGWAVIYCSLVLLRQRSASIGALRLFDRFDILSWHNLIMPVTRFIGVGLVALNGGSMIGFLGAWFFASLLEYITLPILAAYQLKKRHLLKRVLWAKSSLRRPRAHLWSFVIKSNIDSTLAAASVDLPTVLVMRVFGPSWVAIYRLAEEVAKLLSEGFKLLDQVIYPELATLVSSGKAGEIWRLVIRTAMILLAVGLGFSLFLWVFLDVFLRVFMPIDYGAALPLATLLVAAAILLGVAAPFYPVLYATDRPERAIYARGAGVFVFIISFFVLAHLIGRLAPGWAMLLGNAVAVSTLFFLARQAVRDATIDATIREREAKATFKPMPGIALSGQSARRIWGLPLAEWQRRAFQKAGAQIDTPLSSTARGIRHHVNWILSAELSKSFAVLERTALIYDGQVIALTSATADEAQALIGKEAIILQGWDFSAVAPTDIDSGYNSALRKQEPPYIVNIEAVPPEQIMRRQFKSAYKGITDFVTKWIWPVPAYYVTRLCANLRLTPNMVTTVGFFLMLFATYFFWEGQWALGFLCGWSMTFLDTVDGKLARTTMTYSKWGNTYDHGIDLIHPPFWYWAWFHGLGGSYELSNPFFIALLAIWVGYIVDRIVEGIFIRKYGFHIHVWTRFNSTLRLFIARRNPNTFIMMIGMMLSVIWADAGWWAFATIAVWTWVCIFANFATLMVAMFIKTPTKSWMDA